MKTLERSVYRSTSQGLRVKVRSALQKRHPVTGDVIETIPAVYAEFGLFGPEVPIYNPLEGGMDTTAEIIGGFYDLDAVADAKIEAGEWDEDVKAMVRRRLDSLAQSQPGLLQRVDHVVPPASKPWPTYDDTPAKEIPSLAENLGLLGPALAYERENEDRAAVTSDLEGRLGVHPDPAPEPEPVVALEKPKVEKSPGRVVLR